jgi:hypothetical protein
MPPVDGSSMGDRLGRFLSAMSSRPCPATLVHPTSDFLDGLGKLLPGRRVHVSVGLLMDVDGWNGVSCVMGCDEQVHLSTRHMHTVSCISMPWLLRS